VDVPNDLKARNARRIAPLATAIGVIIAATIGLVLARINPPTDPPPTPSISTTAH
jgi:hypothetical protein